MAVGLTLSSKLIVYVDYQTNLCEEASRLDDDVQATPYLETFQIISISDKTVRGVCRQEVL